MLNHLAIANAIGDDEKKPVLDGFDQHLVIFFGYLPVLLWLSGPSLALLVVEGLAVLRVQTQGSFGLSVVVLLGCESILHAVSEWAWEVLVLWLVPPAYPGSSVTRPAPLPSQLLSIQAVNSTQTMRSSCGGVLCQRSARGRNKGLRR